MLFRKIKLFFITHWVKVLITAGVLIVLGLAVWGLSSLESFYLHLTLATLPLQVLLVAVNALIFVYMYMMVFRGGFGKLEKGVVKSDDINVRFSDVIGIDEGKQEAWEVVELIKDRTRLQKIGGKILRGLLLVGPPGCGKTLLAKAIATEAGVPFISMAASEFTEIFVGVGASRVRKLFKKARSLAYANGASIIFIDELDAIGSTRSFSYLGGGMEKNTTQNQLLVEMDGLQQKQENVIVIAATNAAEEVLDQALLRPGRFDRKIYVDKPDLEGREKLFKYYLSKIKYDSSVDVGKLARRTVGKSPADIENVVKESALIATRNKKDIVSYKEMSEALERIEMGIKHRKKMQPYEKEMVAYHESGHLVALYMLHPTSDVFKASIISRGGALGVVHSNPREEWFTKNKDMIIADIQVDLGGFVAEKIRFGVTASGVSSDFSGAMYLAHNMVWRYGMGEGGFIGDFNVIPDTQLSEDIKQKLNEETNKIFKKCLKEVEKLLTDERPLLDRFAKELLEKEELEYDEIEAIFKEYGKKKAQMPVPKAIQGL